ncbi:putative pentatricopeptide repeat-containing protein At3g49142 [Tasmannia lanceolata]|uniref:putative pentatricopeptide repeat-containing protein At3g49142 n=1 Tax=Tasmannia lanceolata TaxID=3420 RepID=UPI0040635FB5
MNKETFVILLRCWMRSTQTLRNPASTYSTFIQNPSNSSFYECILHALENITSVSELKRTHALVITNGFLSKSVLASRLINGYARFLGLGDAHKLFENLPKQTVYTYSYMLKAYIESECYELALRFYSRMLLVERIIPDHVTFSLIVRACIGLGDTQCGKLVHVHILVTGLELDLHLATALMDFYSKCERIHNARILFDRMPRRDVFTWTVMLYGYLQIGNYNEAFNMFSGMKEAGLKANIVTWNALISGFVRGGLIYDALREFKQMQADGVQPDKVSMCTIIPAFAHFAILKSGLESHAYIIRMGYELDLFVVSSLIDMYAKCGKLASARYLFDRVKVKDAGLWNVMIVGYGIHGHCMEALELFHQMGDLGVRPNNITFTSILSSCSHAGMVNEGCSCFDSMIRDYGIVPCREHYACMVDMFGRAGQLEEAYEFIISMPLEATKDVWGAFLGACRTHRHWKLAEIAAQNIFRCKDISQSAGYHVAMANVYAETGRWGDVGKLRTSIRDGGLKKKTGFSWVEVGHIVHTFCMADMSHPQSREIYALLRSFEDLNYRL